MLDRKNLVFGFVGFGNMAGAIATGLVDSGALRGGQILAHDPDREGLRAKASGIGARMAEDNLEVFEESDVVLLGVKPHLTVPVLREHREAIERKRPVLVSIAVNKPFSELAAELPENAELLVVMPNLPVALGAGVFCCESLHSLREDNLKVLLEIFGRVAKPVFVDGAQMGVAGAISGCGPAFVAVFIEALADAGVKRGLGRAAAYELASSMIEGSAKLQRVTGKHPAQIKDEVCSPGGTTIRGVSALDKAGFRASVEAAIAAATGEEA